MEEAPAYSPKEKPIFVIKAKNGLCCPLCGSTKLCRDGFRYLADGSQVQRYLCRNCRYRFSQPKTERRKPLQKTSKQNLKIDSYYNEICRVGAPGPKSRIAKNSAGAVYALEQKTGEEKSGHAGATTLDNADVKGKLVEYSWQLKKNGYSPATIETRVKKLERLIKLGADLFKPETVKEAIAKTEWNINTKINVAAIYGNFAKFCGLNWEPPIYKPLQRIPFIPTEAEIDTLIAGAGRKTAALLQLLKETGVRIGEASRLTWEDIDFERRVIRFQAEKNSNPRIFRVSQKLIDMLNAVPRENQTVFNDDPRILANNYRELRLKLAQRFKNPRLKQITFHTIRHWKATTEYHKTKDILHVKELLGHKCLDSTLVYVNIEKAIYGADNNDEFTVKTAKTPEEIKALLEVGFEYICEKDGLMFFRKRK